MGAALTITTEPIAQGGVAMTAVGELDLSTIDRFENALSEAIDQAGADGSTTVDLRGVDYLDSAALNVLFAHAERIGRIVVQPLLMRGITIAGLDRVVTIEPAAD